MDAMSRARAMQLLGAFNDQMTRVIDGVYGTQWAEIEEMSALVALASERALTTRRLAEVSGLGRRAVSRLVVRLRAEGVVATRTPDADQRAVEVVLTPEGDRLAETLRTAITAFLRHSAEIATEISLGLGDPASVALPDAPADALELLGRICASGAALVSYMPAAAREGKRAARQRAALVAIAMQGGVRPSSLSAPLEVSPAGVAYIVDQLCAKGFVERRRGEVAGDARAVLLRVTDEGMRAVASVSAGIESESERLTGLFAEIAAWQPPARATSAVTGRAQDAPAADAVR